jgi:hypothetical protein
MGVRGVSGDESTVPVSGSGSVESVSLGEKVAGLIAEYNEEINTAGTVIFPNIVGMPTDMLASIQKRLLDVYGAVNGDKTPEQLASIPGFVEEFRHLIHTFKAAINQCLAQLNATGKIDFSVLPLSGQIEGGTTFVKKHGELYETAGEVYGLLTI